MNKQFIAGFAIAALVLVGAVTFASWNGAEPVPGISNTGNHIAQQTVDNFSAQMRAGVEGHPIEGYEPSMFLGAFPGLQGSDFEHVNAMIGEYRYENGEVAYDTLGATELHTAARAITDAGMGQLLSNVAARLQVNLEDASTLNQIFAALEESSSASASGSQNSAPDGDSAPVAGSAATVTGTIACLPHKGDGPHTMECAFGLKSTDGKYYALQNLWDVAPGMTDTEVQVRVTGALTAPAANETYDIAGTIKVTKVEKL